jgi:hypothetical protein
MFRHLVADLLFNHCKIIPRMSLSDIPPASNPGVSINTTPPKAQLSRKVTFVAEISVVKGSRLCPTPLGVHVAASMN